MKKMMIFCLMLLSLLWGSAEINAVVGGDEICSSPCYTSSIDYDNPNFSGDRWLYKVVFQNGEKLEFYDDDVRHTFLIINGSFENTYVKIENGVSLISAEFLCEKSGFELNRQTDNELTISRNGKSILLSAESNIAQLGGSYEQMSHKAEIIDGEVFVPLRYVCEALGAEVTYSNCNIAPFYNFVINVENRKRLVNKEEALAKAENFLIENLNSLTLESDTDEQAVYENIENLSCVDETASFWLIDGPYLLLADKHTGDLFVKHGNGRRGHGSYSESIVKADSSEKNSFCEY